MLHEDANDLNFVVQVSRSACFLGI